MYTPDDILWTAGFFNERFPAPVSPLGWSLLGPLIEDTALRDPLRFLGFPDAESIPLVRLVHGHPYSNAQAFHIYYRVFPDALVPEDAYRYFPDGDVHLRKKAPYPRSILEPRFMFSLFRAFLSDPADFSPWHNYRKWAGYAREHDERVAALKDRIARLSQSDSASVFAALDQAREIHRNLLRIHRWSLMHADLTYAMVKRLVRAWISKERADEIAATFVSGAPNKTMEVDAALGLIKDELNNKLLEASNWEEFTREASPEVLERFQEFLAEHGHRSFSLDIAQPTFAEDPYQVIPLLRRLDQRRKLPSITAEPRHALAWPKQQALNSVRALALHYSTLREDQRYYWQKSLALSRRLYLILADRLVEERVLSSRQDVFFATHDELASHFLEGRDELAESIGRRKAEWEKYELESKERPGEAYASFLCGDTPLQSKKVQDQGWKGRPVSPGSASGAARVIRSAQDLGRVQRGDILVAPSTDPAWTPVFSMISGLVMERGGVLSHGAVVAREYHIPAVVGVADIMQQVGDGEWIQVDGSKGVVARLEK